MVQKYFQISVSS